MPNPRTLRMAMIGGGRDAFIGSVHRMAARLDGEIELIAGALSSTPEKSLISGRELGLADDRNYPTWQALLEGESKRSVGDRVDFITIVTPNHSHFEIARACVERGFHIVIDKPMTTTVQQAEELARLVKQRGTIGCVTYNYSGYPMVKQARDLIRHSGGGDGSGSSEIGEIRKVIIEYNQGWLATAVEKTGQKQAAWRADPTLAGIGGAIGDIGSHAEQLCSYVTGLQIESLCADLSSLVKGRVMDDDANILLRFKGGARGVLIASQICTGERNGLRLRLWGTKGGLAWSQEEPNHLIVKSIDSPERIYHRGEPYLCDAAKLATRLPPGHPEAFIEAFANVYRGVASAVRSQQEITIQKSEVRKAGPAVLDYPTIEDGLRGVKFIHAAVESSQGGGVWTMMK